MKSQVVNHAKLVLTLCGFALAIGIFATPSRADEWDKRTIVTVNQPIQVRETLLQPGTYVFKLLNSSSDRHIVQIFNSDQSHIINTVLAVPTERSMDQITGTTDLTFWETPAGYAKALRDWYYPGDTVGQEFTYPKHLSPVETAAVIMPTPPAVVVPPPPPPPPVEQPEVQSETQPMTTEPVPQPEVAQAAPAPAPAPAEQPSTLPKTASPYPLIGLSGLLSLGLFSVLRLKRSS